MLVYLETFFFSLSPISVEAATSIKPLSCLHQAATPPPSRLCFSADPSRHRPLSISRLPSRNPSRLPSPVRRHQASSPSPPNLVTIAAYRPLSPSPTIQPRPTPIRPPPSSIPLTEILSGFSTLLLNQTLNGF